MTQTRLITDTFEYAGRWFLPGCDDYTVEGTMKYTKGDIRLKIRGPLRDETRYQTVRPPYWFHRENEKVDTLLGITEEGLQITLENCVMVKQTNSLDGTGMKNVITHYLASFMCIGTHYAKPSDRNFDEVTITYSNFKEWINESGISTDQDFHSNTFSITAVTPPSYEGNLTEDFKYVIWHNMKNPGFQRDRFDADIVQNTLFTIKSEKSHYYQEFHKIFYRLQNFMMMCIKASIRPLLITGRTLDPEYKSVLIYPGEVDVYGEHTVVRNDQMFLPFRNLSNNIETIFQNWLQSYDELEDGFDLFFEVMVNSKLYPQDKFENIIQALEAYHRGRFDDELMEKSRYKRMIDDILDQLTDSNQKDWIKKNRTRGNDLSLSQKLVQLCEQFPYIFLDINKRDEFVVLVQDTRNYFAHHATKLKEMATKNTELFYLEQRLNVLMTACMLSELRLGELELERFIMRYTHMQRQVSLVWASDPYDWII